ncbi:accessory Sec system glycosyltransferase Asp1 [Paucilactobacillus sp. N302-9]
MFYFVNQYFMARNSSVEHAEIKRLQLFKKFREPAKLLTFNFDPVLPQTAAKFDVESTQFVNLFDFFRGTVDYVGQPLKVDDMPFPASYQITSGNSIRDITDGDLLIGKIYFIIGTVAQIGEISYFDRAGNLTLKSQYDIRGFKASDGFYDKQGHLIYETLYKPDGTRFMERYYVASVDQTSINSLNRLIDYRGKDYYFDTIEELQTFFLDQLNQQTDEPAIFVSDRPAQTNGPMMAMTSHAQKYLWVPFNHLQNPNDINSPINDLYQGPFSDEGQTHYDGVIVMAQRQAADLKQRVPKLNVQIISGAVSDNVDKPVKMAARTPHKLLLVSRLDFDKNIDQALLAFKQIRQTVQDATLDIWGYGGEETVNQFKQQVIDLKLDEPGVVNFKDYQPQIGHIYDEAQLLIDTSQSDGQPLAMQEALSHGVPVVSFDYRYGPNELIEEEQNGYLVGSSADELAKKSISLLNDAQKLQSFSDAAYELSKRYDAETIFQQWLTLKA